MRKWLVTIIAVVVLALGVFAMSNSYASKTLGTIQVELVDLEGSVVSDKKISFEEKDTLISLLEENYRNVVIENGMLMSIEDFTTPEDWSTFISIYVDDEMSMVGIKDIVFEDGTKISFIMTKYIYE